MKAVRLVLTMVMAVVLAACATPPDDPTPDQPGSASPSVPEGVTASPVTTATPGPSAPAGGPPPSGAAAPSVTDDPAPIGLEVVATGLSSPISVTASPDGWLFVNERAGRIVAVQPESGDTTIALDISDRVLGEGEQGLLGLTLHPGWRGDDRRAFVHYTDRAGDTVLSEFLVTDVVLPPRLDVATERVLLRVDQPYANHNGGQLAFGPDGYLYVGLGDGGAGGDPLGNGQNPETLLGTILRLDVDTTDGDLPYAIPEDNPFVDGGGASEVHLYGLRNPWRFSFDRATGQLWVADVGQSALEEVNRLDPKDDAGANLGWNVMEGSRCFADAACSTDGLVLPVSEYGRELGCSVTGGYVYRGSAIDGLAGWYLFGDYCAGTVFAIPSDASEPTAPRILLESGAAISAFGEDADGELYVADLNGTLYRIVRG